VHRDRSISLDAAASTEDGASETGAGEPCLVLRLRPGADAGWARLPHAGRPVATEVEFGAALCAHLREFAVIRGVANSAKHFQLRQGTVQKLKSHDQDAPSSPANTFSQSFDPWGTSWGSSWGSSWSQTRVQIEGTNGAHRNLVDVAKAVCEMWEKLAAQHSWTL